MFLRRTAYRGILLEGIALNAAEFLSQCGQRGEVRRLSIRAFRELIVSLTVEKAAGFRFLYAAPLFEEECDALTLTMIAQLPDPLLLHWSRAPSAFATCNDPMDTGQIQCAEIFKQGFHREKSDSRRRGPEMIDSRQTMLSILDAHPPPDM